MKRIITYPVVSEFRSLCVWERPICCTTQDEKIDQVLFIPAAPLFNHFGKDWSMLKIHYLPLDESPKVMAELVVGKFKYEAFRAQPFAICLENCKLKEGGILTLAKESMFGYGVALPDFVLQVELCQ